jgi:hypothetical protein
LILVLFKKTTKKKSAWKAHKMQAGRLRSVRPEAHTASKV